MEILEGGLRPMFREIYSLKLREVGSKSCLINSYVRGSSSEVDAFIEQVYGSRIAEKMEKIKLTLNGKFKFPWELTQKVVDLELIYGIKPLDNFTYLCKIDNEFYVGSKEEYDKYPSILDKICVKLNDEDLITVDKLNFKFITSNWEKVIGNTKLVKKLWKKKVKI